MTFSAALRPSPFSPAGPASDDLIQVLARSQQRQELAAAARKITVRHRHALRAGHEMAIQLGHSEAALTLWQALAEHGRLAVLSRDLGSPTFSQQVEHQLPPELGDDGQVLGKVDAGSSVMVLDAGGRELVFWNGTMQPPKGKARPGILQLLREPNGTFGWKLIGRNADLTFDPAQLPIAGAPGLLRLDDAWTGLQWHVQLASAERRKRVAGVLASVLYLGVLLLGGRLLGGATLWHDLRAELASHPGVWVTWLCMGLMLLAPLVIGLGLGRQAAARYSRRDLTRMEELTLAGSPIELLEELGTLPLLTADLP